MGRGLSWRVAAACAAGTAHVEAGLPCQDRCVARVARTCADDVLGIFVADGAGSARLGGEGAEAAIAAADGFLTGMAAQSGQPLDAATSVALVAAVRDRLAALADARGCAPRDLACTFLGLLSTADRTLALQIGDGAIVVDTGDGLELAVAPMGGEYANTTCFVTDADAAERVAARAYAAPVLRAAAFSDGFQRLAIDMNTARPHAPLFTHLFGVLERREAGEAALQAALARFLDSPSVNQRTDDDKALALALARS